MTFGLDASFEEHLELFPADLPSSGTSMSSSAEAKAIIASLVKQLKKSEEQAQKHEVEKGEVQRRLNAKVATQTGFPTDVIDRLQRIENDCQRLRSENTKLSDNWRAAESETTTLRDKLADQAQKVKCANKKTKNAKQVAEKEEEKAQGAVQDKKRHLDSERKMSKEKNDALAALQTERKIVENLRAELSAERSGKSHLRETEGTDSNDTTVIIPMEFLIRREHYLRIADVLESTRISYIDRAKEWYEKWKALDKEEVVKVVGANYVDDDKENKLYEGMIEDGFMTGAEHALAVYDRLGGSVSQRPSSS
jgi:DNA repair exonuclease SbcCD ATPase subunit